MILVDPPDQAGADGDLAGNGILAWASPAGEPHENEVQHE